MILLPCPWCGPRNVDEFRHVGEVRRRPDPPSAPITQWRGYLYERDNRSGWVAERWFHRAGCGRYVTVERHTRTNEVRGASTAGGTG